VLFLLVYLILSDIGSMLVGMFYPPVRTEQKPTPHGGEGR
jgi:hypothetical protein